MSALRHQTGGRDETLQRVWGTKPGRCILLSALWDKLPGRNSAEGAGTDGAGIAGKE